MLAESKEADKRDQKCWNCANFIPTNDFSEESPRGGYCKIEVDQGYPYDQTYDAMDSCDKKPSAWKERRTYHPAYAYGCINQCPECGRWTYFIHDMNIDDCITENEGFCSYCGFTQVEDY